PQLVMPFAYLFATSALLTLGMAIGVLVLHAFARRRENQDRREGDTLALEFARFLCGRSDAVRLRDHARAVRSEVFWTALEPFSDNSEGDQWRQLTTEFRALPEVVRLRARLTHGSAAKRAHAARRLGLLEDPENRYILFRAMQAGPVIVSLTAGLALA